MVARYASAVAVEDGAVARLFGAAAEKGPEDGYGVNGSLVRRSTTCVERNVVEPGAGARVPTKDVPPETRRGEG